MDLRPPFIAPGESRYYEWTTKTQIGYQYPSVAEGGVERDQVTHRSGFEYLIKVIDKLSTGQLIHKSC